MTQLRKALKTSEICMTKPENLYLLVNILNKYVYYFFMGYDFMTAQDINDLISFIKETVDEMEDQEPAKESIIHLENTKLAIKAKQVDNERMQQIILWTDLHDKKIYLRAKYDIPSTSWKTQFHHA